MFMGKNSQLTRVILYQNLGFLAVIVICFLVVGSFETFSFHFLASFT